MDQTSRALVAFSVSKIGEVSLGRSSGAECFERSTAASALGKNDARLLLVKGIEARARSRVHSDPPHRPKEKDLDENAILKENGDDRGKYCVSAAAVFWTVDNEWSDEYLATR